MLVNGLTGYHPMESGMPIPGMDRGEWSQLMMIYGAGFIGLYVIFVLLYLHAYRLRAVLDLNAMEIHETNGVVQENLLMIGIGVVALILAFLQLPSLSGLTYMLIGPLQTALGTRRGRKRKWLIEHA
jgi:hypothetical protein